MNPFTSLEQENLKLRRELQWAQLKIQALEEELRRERIQRYGPASETLSSLQLELLDEEPGVTGEEVEAEARREPLSPTEQEGQRKRHPGRQRLPENLPRVEDVIPCPETKCADCGSETAVIGHDECEVLDVEPARVPLLPARLGDDAARAASHRGEGTGERPSGHRNGGGEIL